jgi:Zn-finger nucleic acid-binding protein
VAVPPFMELTCPKCQGSMRTYERNGVHVDQCGDCRGIFLDRGELDRLIDAENSWHAGGGAPAAQQSGNQQSGHQPSSHQQSSSSHGRPAEAGLGAVVGEVLSQVRGQKHSSHDREYSDDRRYSKKRKESFLGDLFG